MSHSDCLEEFWRGVIGDDLVQDGHLATPAHAPLETPFADQARQQELFSPPAGFFYSEHQHIVIREVRRSLGFTPRNGRAQDSARPPKS
jgi:hypothetical protein